MEITDYLLTRFSHLSSADYSPIITPHSSSLVFDWHRNPGLRGKKPIISYQSKPSFDIVNLLLGGEKAIQKNGGFHSLQGIHLLI
jgi:hypothetical protein